MRPASNVDLRNGVCVGVVLWLTEASNDIRVLDLDAARPGNAKSPSKAGFGRGEFALRCMTVDLRSDVFRTGDCEVMGVEKSYSLSVSSVSMGDRDAPSRLSAWPNILSKSLSRLATTPCKLLLFVTGLNPVGVPLRFITPSLRLRGLDLPGAPGERSGRRCANSNLMGLSFKPNFLQSVSMLSKDSELEGRAGVSFS
jgi:hypothetical protein